MNQQLNEDHAARQATRREGERLWRIRNSHLFTVGIVKGWPLSDQQAAAEHLATRPSAQERRETAIKSAAERLAGYQARIARQRDDARPYRGSVPQD